MKTKRQAYQQPIVRIANKIGISEAFARQIVVCHHELKFLHTKKQLSKTTFTFDKGSKTFMNKISKALHVSIEAIVTASLLDIIENKPEWQGTDAYRVKAR